MFINPIKKSSYSDLYKDAKVFSCGCREWALTKRDLKVNADFSEAEFNLIHECSKIKVWQAKLGLHRGFARS